jgi:hypothetical protein
MLSMPDPPQRRTVPRPPVRRSGDDPLDEFADEREALIVPVPPAPRASLVRPDAVAETSRLRPKPEVVVRVHVPILRAVAAMGLATTGLAALLGAGLFVARDRGPEPPPYVVPPPSPIEVEYPDYPGAPALQAASAVPSTLVVEQVAASIDAPAPAKDSKPVPVTPDSPRRAASTEPRRASSSMGVVEASTSLFGVRGPMPQLVAASTRDAGAATRFADPPSADAPPRRIGPPLTFTALGGTLSPNARLALVLDVTEQGDVARVVSHEAVDVHPDVIDSVTFSARNWRYEPARRDGVPVPARLRVVVQLKGEE